jgi:hypothetical protein
MYIGGISIDLLLKRQNQKARARAMAGLASISSMLVAGCTPVVSSYAPMDSLAGGKLPTGPVYNLPVKTMAVTVGSNGFGLFVAIHSLQYEGDPDAHYILRYNPDTSSADKLDLEIDRATGLLKSVKVEADSKAAEAIDAFGKSTGMLLGAFESARTGKTRLYASMTLNYWPRASMTKAEADNALAAFNSELNDVVAAVIQVQGCRLKNEEVLAASEWARICRANGSVDSQAVRVEIAIDYTPYKGAADASACRVGICTRAESMASISLAAQGSLDSARVPLPNGSSPVPLPLRRYPFTKAVTDYAISNGLVTKMGFEKGAELPAIFAIPGNLVGSVVGGFVDGVAEAGKLRKARTDAAASKKEFREKKDDEDEGQAENNRSGYADTAFDASVIAIVFPLPQLGIDVAGQSAESARQPPAPDGVRTLDPPARQTTPTPRQGVGRTTLPGPPSPTGDKSLEDGKADDGQP